jgi:hypothetical protein
MSAPLRCRSDPAMMAQWAALPVPRAPHRPVTAGFPQHFPVRNNARHSDHAYSVEVIGAHLHPCAAWLPYGQAGTPTGLHWQSALGHGPQNIPSAELRQLYTWRTVESRVWDMRQSGELNITDSDIERGAELLQRWIGTERGFTSIATLKELVAETVATVGRGPGLRVPKELPRHDRSLYRSPEL